MIRHALLAMLTTTALLAASCDDGGSRSRRRRSRRDGDDRPAERQPAERTAQRETEASRGPDEARTAQRQAETVPPADRAPGSQRAIIADEVIGTWTFEDDGDTLQLRMAGDGKWELDFRWDYFIMVSEGTTRGTYRADGSKIRFRTTEAGRTDLTPEYATMPSATQLRLKVGGDRHLKTLARAGRRNDGGGRQAERREEPEEDRLDPRALVGVWTTNAPVGQVTLTLQADGNFILEMLSPYAAMPARYYGSYELAGNRLTLKYGGGMMPDDTSIVHMPDPNLLIAKGLTGVTQEYRRVQQNPAGGR
jgi:hypothetical protein